MTNGTDRVRNEVMRRVQEERNITHKTTRRKANCFGRSLSRKLLLRQVIEGKTGGRVKATEDEEEYVSRYWMTLKKREDTEN